MDLDKKRLLFCIICINILSFINFSYLVILSFFHLVGQKSHSVVLLKSNFPPARPSVSNLKAICLYGNGRPRYPDSSFPSSGYAYARRAGKAVNRLEPWFSRCCNGGLAHGNGQILCCAKQAVSTQNEKHNM